MPSDSSGSVKSPVSLDVDRPAVPPEGQVHTRHWIGNYLDNFRKVTVPARWFLLGTTLLGMAWATFMLMFNLYMKERGFPEGVMGRVLSLQSFGMVAMAIPAALLVSRMSARAMMIVSTIGAAVGFAWQTLAPQVGMILAASFTTGGMLAFSRIVGSPFLMNHSTPSERAHVFSLSFAATLGSGLITQFGAGSLHHGFASLHEEENRHSDGILFHGKYLIDVILDDCEGFLAHLVYGNAVGQCEVRGDPYGRALP